MGAEGMDTQLCPNPACGRDNPHSETVCPHCSADQRQLLGRGFLLKGRYRIDKVLGCGGFGAVYLATDLPTGQQMAVKENRQHRTFQRFAREAQLLMTLDHPHLPKVREAFWDEVTGRAFLVMDYAEGETLETRVRRKGRMSWLEAQALFAPLVKAVAYLHQQGVVHRDIKPANIILLPSPSHRLPVPSPSALKCLTSAQHFHQGRHWGQKIVKGKGSLFAELGRGAKRLVGTWRDGGQKGRLWVRFGTDGTEEWRCECPEGSQGVFCAHLVALLWVFREHPQLFTLLQDAPSPPVALVDFGVAKVLEPINPHRPRSSSLVVWTDGFSPPEQYRIGVEVDERADQYALAATLLFALTGIVPADALTRIEQVRRGKVAFLPRPPDVPSPTWEALVRAMHLDPQKRFPDVCAFWSAACGEATKPVFVTPVTSSGLLHFVSRWRFRLPFLTAAQVLAGHADAVTSVAFAPDGAWLASGSFDRTIWLWESALPRRVQALKGHEDAVLAVVFGADGQWLASAGADRTVRLWEWRGGRAIITLHGHSEAVLCLANSPDGRFWATGSADGFVRLFRWSNGQLVWRSEPLRAFVNALAFSPNGQWLAFGCADGRVGLLSVTDGRVVRELCKTGYSVTCLAYSPDGLWLAVGDEGVGVQMWQMPEGVFMRTLRVSVPKGQGWVNALAFSPDSFWLATGGMDEVVRLWRTSDGRLLRILKGHKGWITALAFSPDGGWLASGSSDKTVRLWQLG